jgi:hypothetical protein
LRVRDWNDLQHYGNRDGVPWIKLHKAVVTGADFNRLSFIEQRHLILLWCVASDYRGFVPDEPVWVGQRLCVSEPVDLNAFISAGWLVRVSADEALAEFASTKRKQKSLEAVDKKREEKIRGEQTRARTHTRAPAHAHPRARGRHSDFMSKLNRAMEKDHDHDTHTDAIEVEGERLDDE